jgi:hypothetical protein
LINFRLRSVTRFDGFTMTFGTERACRLFQHKPCFNPGILFPRETLQNVAGVSIFLPMPNPRYRHGTNLPANLGVGP